MITVINLLVLSLSSAMVGLFGRALLLDLGIIRGFHAGIWACVVIASVFALSQLLFRVFLLLLKPTRAISLDVSEILAYASALVLVPSLLGVRFPVPYETLEKLEPLAHAAVFAVLFGLFRLMSFFAAVYGEKANRSVVAWWAAYAGIVAILAPFSLYNYLDAVAVNREIIMGETVDFAVDNTYATACAIPENKRVIMPMDAREGDHLAFVCAPKPDKEDFPEVVYVVLESYDRILTSHENPKEVVPTSRLTRTLSFSGEGWTPLTVPVAELPAETVCITLSWTPDDPDGFRSRYGLMPGEEQGYAMMVSGPWAQRVSQGRTKPSVVVILAEGLGAEHMSLYGYDRETTPNLARHAAGMIMCEEAYTSTPETPGAAMSLLTGLNPLAHGYYASSSGPLPGKVLTIAELMRNQGYFTVAYTEGRGMEKRDLVFGSGFERGFILFDDYYPLELRAEQFADSREPRSLVPAGARVTLGKAGDWIEANPDLQYFVFIRLGELGTPRYLSRYGNGFMKRTGRSSPMDVYDTAITYLDLQLGLFLDRLAGLPEDRQPILLITSTNGYEFFEPGRGAWRRSGEAKRNLYECALRVPMLIRIPGCDGRTNRTPASLLDVAPTLAALTGMPLPYRTEGQNVLEDSRAREIVSIMGDPIAQSMRSGKWRFTWQTGLSSKSLERVDEASVIEFIDIARYRDNEIIQDNVWREPQLVDAFKSQLSTVLRDSRFGNTVLTMVPGRVPSL